MMLKNPRSSLRDYLIKQLPVATAFVNTDFQVVHASDRWIDFFGFFGPEVFGSTLFDLFGSPSEKWRADIKNCFKGQIGSKKNYSFVNSEDERIQFKLETYPWYDENENVIGAIIQNEDVSQHLAAIEEKEKLEAVIQEKSETAKIGSWTLDYNGDIWWCPMTKKIHEVSEDYVPSQKSAISFFKEGVSRQKILQVIKLARENGEPWSERLQIVTNDGQEKWVICSGKPLFINGKYSSLIGTFQDVTQRILQGVKTSESERLLKMLIDNLPINVFIKDKDCKKILANKHELSFFGLRDEKEMLGKDDSHFMDREAARKSQEEDEYVLKNVEPILGSENVIIKRNGEIVTILSSKIPMLDDNGRVVGLLGFSLDISILKSKEEELRNLINVTSLQNKKLIDFAHIVSHNLRSHAANFSMLLEFLMAEKDELEREKITKMLTKASDSLLDTLDNLNEVVAITTHTNLDKKPVFLRKAVDKVTSDLSSFLMSKKAAVINNIPDKAKVRIVPQYLESILMNFISNGVKYSEPTRTPIVKLKTEEENDQLVLTIEDNGVGINLKKHGDKLFGMYKTFHQNEDARGMGLYIAKNQIEAMNGKVSVQSEVGSGTKFKIYFNGIN